MTFDSISGEGSGGIRNIILVHGAFADGSGWEGVHNILAEKGYRVTVVQHPVISLQGDAAYVARAIENQEGAVLLVGHSYGGAVISEAGGDPRVKGLVYIAGWVPDSGESVLTLIDNLPPDSPLPPLLPPQEGFIFVDPARFSDSFAQDVDPAKAAFMAVSQVPWGEEAAGGTVREAAWRSKPSWYLVAASDRMIPPAGQRAMATRAGARTIEVEGSHAVFVARPEIVAEFIEQAAMAEAVSRMREE